MDRGNLISNMHHEPPSYYTDSERAIDLSSKAHMTIVSSNALYDSKNCLKFEQISKLLDRQ